MRKVQPDDERRKEIRRSVERALGKIPVISSTERPENLAEYSDSDDEVVKNRIGNVPLKWYDDEDHIGYDIYGNKIGKKDHGDSIDAFLARTDDPNAFRTVYDALNDEKIVLTDEELSIINRIRKGKFAHRDFDPNEDYSRPIDERAEIVGQSLLPKKNFIPSKWEAKKIVKYVHYIRNGWLKDPNAPQSSRRRKKKEELDIWGDDTGEADKHRYLLPPHKAPLPGHAESYNPPSEYLLTEKELAYQMSLDEDQRQYDFIPTKFDNLRSVPSYKNLIMERYQRCMDIFLAVRQKKREKLNINPDDLLPELPKPSELKPFPTTLSLEYIGHTGVVRAVDISPTGEWIVSGAEDGTVRLWEVSTARCVRLWHLKEQVASVSFNPNPALPMIAVALASGVAILHAGVGTNKEAAYVEHMLRSAPVIYKKGVNVERAAETASEKSATRAISKASMMAKLSQWVSWWQREIPTDDLLRPKNDQVDAQGVSTLEKAKQKISDRKRARDFDEVTEHRNLMASTQLDFEFNEDELQIAAEQYEDDEEYDTTNGLARLLIRIEGGVNHVAWHSQGDYLSSIASHTSSNRSIMVHRITAAASQLPFSKSKGLVQKAIFHPTQPLFLIATQRHVLMYNLQAGKLVKKLQPVTKWISSLAIHPKGNHLIVGGYDRKVSWFDLELSHLPYRTLRYHSKSVRGVSFHKKYPLFATTADDGHIHLFHATVYDDLITNPLIVPLKIINAHLVNDGVGCTDIIFHPTQPWIFSCAADKTIRLFS